MKRRPSRSKNSIPPLHEVLQWWNSLDTLYHDNIAVDVCMRMLPVVDQKHYKESFIAYLSEELPAHRHVARTLSIRTVISFWFFGHKQKDSSEMFLYAVEIGSTELKSLANDALGRTQRLAKAEKDALESWQGLIEGPISDAALLKAERGAMLG
ncbi:MAG: hypothetical protein JWM68_2087 [Verrucomicrobiales bacterium]|nr:hypothetical protein [Verrucomicrobiales bacterium]